MQNVRFQSIADYFYQVDLFSFFEASVAEFCYLLWPLPLWCVGAKQQE
jgi:hypothetical protein